MVHTYGTVGRARGGCASPHLPQIGTYQARRETMSYVLERARERPAGRPAHRSIA